MPLSSQFLVFPPLLPLSPPSPQPSLSAVTSATSARSVASLLSPSSLSSQFRRFFLILRLPISLSSGHHFRRLRYDFSTIFCALTEFSGECYRFGHPRIAGAWDTVAVGHWVPEQSLVCHERIGLLGFEFGYRLSLDRISPIVRFPDLIRRGRSMTTAPSSDSPAQSASAATAPALMDHVLVGPAASQAPASSASSVVQPASARRQHRPADTTDTTSTDGTGASGSQPGITTLLYC
ncbi:hypothetical protein L3X38_020022 [Prunus dulcis]|uniref:Uncharacterized protein n=1 Tax=Prunus dulcis TaxID=3755 RepID=A0AAD4ZD37_PRUDU|nr:hypothetical protein L3X38_020022 [Prunus dulcis]